MGGELVTSSCSGNIRSSYVAAHWPTENPDQNLDSDLDLFQNTHKINIGQVKYFIKQKFQPDKICLFAYVKWHKSNLNHNWFGTSAVVLSNECHPSGPFSFIPAHRILCKCAFIKKICHLALKIIQKLY